MGHYKLKKRSKGQEEPVEINVTPMIDMFSVLNTFLLMSAVFSATGFTRIEVPFFSSKPPPPQKELDEKPEKVVSITVDNADVTMEVGVSNNSSGVKKDTYKTDDAGLDLMQAKLYELRKENPKFDKVTMMTELDVKYETLIKVIGACRELKAGRPPIPWPAEYKLPVGVDSGTLIPKIILGNIIL
jgi:biopolymer transport protein ExbD